MNHKEHDDDDDDDDDDNDNDEIYSNRIWTILILLGSIPLFFTGQYKIGLCFIVFSVLYNGNCCDGLLIKKKIPEIDQYNIKYNIYQPNDILIDILQYQEKIHKKRKNNYNNNNIYDDNKKKMNKNNDTSSSKTDNEKVISSSSSSLSNGSIIKDTNTFHVMILAASNALAKKYNKLTTSSIKQQQQQQNINNLALLCQEVCYIGLNEYLTCNNSNSVKQQQQREQNNNNVIELVDGCFALLALIAKNETIRERHIQQADLYGFNILINCMKSTLEHAKTINNNHKEQVYAEIQRKGCLMFGALADDDDDTNTIALQIVQEGGLNVILNTISWFRLHNQVANWGLWSIFILCYKNIRNKVVLVVELNGIPIILQCMENNIHSIEVIRHGIAIIFDLLRVDDENKNSTSSNNNNKRFDVRKVRDVALSNGLHRIIRNIMIEYDNNDNVPTTNNNTDIMMMGREILVGTGYTGSIPEP